MFYNVRVIDYITSTEITICKKAIYKNEDNKKDSVHSHLSNKNTDSANEVDIERSLSSSTQRTKAMVYKYARANVWSWFVTLTFSPKVCDNTNYQECSKVLKIWLNNHVQKNHIKYLIVPERGKNPTDGKQGKIHYHGLFTEIPVSMLKDSGHKDKQGRSIFQFRSYDANVGLCECERVDDLARISSYITKYITKDICTMKKGNKRYWASRGLSKGDELRIEANESLKQMYIDMGVSADYVSSSVTQYNEFYYFQFNKN